MTKGSSYGRAYHSAARPRNERERSAHANRLVIVGGDKLVPERGEPNAGQYSVDNVDNAPDCAPSFMPRTLMVSDPGPCGVWSQLTTNEALAHLELLCGYHADLRGDANRLTNRLRACSVERALQR
jgi:hypothetical protein